MLPLLECLVLLEIGRLLLHVLKLRLLIRVAQSVCRIDLALRALASWCLLEAKARSVHFIELIERILLVGPIVVNRILNPDVVLLILSHCHFSIQLLIILFPGSVDVWPVDLATIALLLVCSTSNTTLGSL